MNFAWNCQNFLKTFWTSDPEGLSKISWKIKKFKKCQNVWVSMWDNFQFRSLWEIFDLRDHFHDLHISKITTKDLLTYWFSLLRSHLDEANTLVLATKNFIFILSTCVPVFSLAFVTIFTTSLHVSNLILRTVQISILLILIRLYWFWQFEHFQSWKSFITFKQQMRVSSWHSRNIWTL